MIHPTAVVSADARLGENVAIGPFAVVEPMTEIGDRTELRAHAVVKRGTILGVDNVVHEGAVLGGDPQDLAFRGGATGLRIGDRNQIREGVTIHRATRLVVPTSVGSDCFLMAYVHVAHDDRIADGVIIANNVALAGHVEIGERAFLSGGVVVHQFCRIGRLAMLGGNSKVIKDCLPFVVTDGVPARARGLNLVGLRRAGMTAPELKALKDAYRLLLRSKLPLDSALDQLGSIRDPLVDELAAFARGAQRGFHREAAEAE